MTLHGVQLTIRTQPCTELFSFPLIFFVFSKVAKRAYVVSLTLKTNIFKLDNYNNPSTSNPPVSQYLWPSIWFDCEFFLYLCLCIFLSSLYAFKPSNNCFIIKALHSGLEGYKRSVIYHAFELPSREIFRQLWRRVCSFSRGGSYFNCNDFPLYHLVGFQGFFIMVRLGHLTYLLSNQPWLTSSQARRKLTRHCV